MIILDEKKYAEERLRNMDIGEKPFVTITLLAKYFYHCLGFKKKRICIELNNFMERTFQKYSASKIDWGITIERLASKVNKMKLFQCDGVWVTREELTMIDDIRNKSLERLAFTLLCLAKLQNAKGKSKNYWVNYSIKEIFDLANIKASNIQRAKKIGQLCRLNLIRFPRKIENINIQVLFGYEEGTKVLFIDDFSELGMEYMRFRNGEYTACEKCGVLFKNDINNTKKICTPCTEVPLSKKKLVICVDCGKVFEVNNKNNRATRCEKCQLEKRRKDDRERKKLKRLSLKQNRQ